MLICSLQLKVQWVNLNVPLCIFRSYTRHYFFFQILKNVQLGKQTNWYLVTTGLFTFTTHWSSPSWWICTKTIRYCITVHCYGNMPCCYTTFIRQVSDRCCMCLWILYSWLSFRVSLMCTSHPPLVIVKCVYQPWKGSGHVYGC